MRAAKNTATGFLIALGLAAVALTGCSAGSDESLDGEHSVQEVEVPGETGPSTFADGTFASSLITIEITDWVVIPLGEPGNEFGDGPVMAFWYETTNLAGQETDPLTAWLTHFRVSQTIGTDAPTELTLSAAPDPALMATQTMPIAAGAAVPNAVGYRLLDQSAPVELIAVDTLVNELGSQIIPLE